MHEKAPLIDTVVATTNVVACVPFVLFILAICWDWGAMLSVFRVIATSANTIYIHIVVK